MTAAILALIGATLIGAGLARQHAAAGTVESHASMDPRLFLHLIRRRSWLLGVALANGGFVFVASAIATGRLAVVEPIASTQVLFALLFSARATGRRLGRAEWLAVCGALAGLAGFLVVAAPRAGEGTITPAVPWVFPLVALALLVAVGYVTTRHTSPATHGLTLAALAGLTFGTADALIKLMSEIAGDDGVGALTRHWSLYVWMAAGLVALLLQQSAYHATHLGAAMPATSTLAPTTATLLGAVMLGEQLRGGWAVPVEIVLFALLLLSVARLAASPVLADQGDPAITVALTPT